ncbi:pinensin family lanthipeptide [Roseivirga sp. BDSF3-8]|uniref:pinensin family lanthipeptide n=1 Tax=Roseivirga sp. BDSF3-8 TaxID=3241598 RepID=UPI00353198AA
MKKLKLNQLQVNSFVTDMPDHKANTVKAGYLTYGCTGGWAGCDGGGTGGDGGGSNSCNPNNFYTHRPCDTEPGNYHCEPCA